MFSTFLRLIRDLRPVFSYSSSNFLALCECEDVSDLHSGKKSPLLTVKLVAGIDEGPRLFF